MGFDLIVTLLVLLFVIAALTQEKFGAEVVMLVALLILTGCGVIKIDEALKGFSSPSVITIGSLFIVGAGLQATGAIEIISGLILGRPKPGTPLLRLIAPVAGLSAFMNNTPLVAFFLPIFVHIAKKIRVSPSKLLIPLSYASILGGTCTLIGTSTNFVVDGILQKEGLGGFGMWELGWVGIPVTIVGVLYLATVGQKLLPNRTDILEYAEANPREYTVELIVRPNCPWVGKTIRDSGLRDLPGLYVYALERTGTQLSPVSPDERVFANDILCFSGMVATIVDVQKTRGLDPVEHHAPAASHESLDSLEGVPPRPSPRFGTQLCEVVISPLSPLVGRSVKEVDFRTHYQASIIAVHRSGEKLQQKIGQIVLLPGDTLLIDATSDFARRWRNSRDFVLVSGLDDSAPVEHRRAWLALSIFFGVVLGMSFFSNLATLVALTGAALMVLTSCLSAREAYRNIDLPVLLLIAAALGVGTAFDKSGAAKWIADFLLQAAQPYGNVAVLAVLVVLTGLLTEILSNNACAALMGMLALATAKQLALNQPGLDPRPFLVAVAVASSYGFSTPIGYQTNLMVLGPGGYKFRDYLKIGIPLDLICWTMTILIVSLVWSKTLLM